MNRRVIPGVVQIGAIRKHAARHFDEQWNNVGWEYIAEERLQLILLDEPHLNRLARYLIEGLADVDGRVVRRSMDFCNMGPFRRRDVRGEGLRGAKGTDVSHRYLFALLDVNLGSELAANIPWEPDDRQA